MNERIRELAEHARNYVDDAIELGYPHDQVDDIRDEKFAELIVRECAGVCNDARDSTDYVTTVGMADHCALAILNRFGIKE